MHDTLMHKEPTNINDTISAIESEPLGKALIKLCRQQKPVVQWTTAFYRKEKNKPHNPANASSALSTATNHGSSSQARDASNESTMALDSAAGTAQVNQEPHEGASSVSQLLPTEGLHLHDGSMLHAIFMMVLHEQRKGRCYVYRLRAKDYDLNSLFEAHKGLPGCHSLLYNHINFVIAARARQDADTPVPQREVLNTVVTNVESSLANATNTMATTVTDIQIEMHVMVKLFRKLAPQSPPTSTTA